MRKRIGTGWEQEGEQVARGERATLVVNIGCLGGPLHRARAKLSDEAGDAGAERFLKNQLNFCGM